jgi:hypothetical protein
MVRQKREGCLGMRGTAQVAVVTQVKSEGAEHVKFNGGDERAGLTSVPFIHIITGISSTV